ncbi:hypothetical protein [Oceanobacillus kimchii]|uniref:hypothetical protein n=1 Tax=Oceanobacillus kimchii TaxID=746691 RepID=UPI00034B2D19|nr:hypothetical protein [Oceanobacillus kimchii]
MKLLFVTLFNFFLLTLSTVTFLENTAPLKIKITSIIVVIILINFLLFMGYILLSYLGDKFIRFEEKRKWRKYTLYNWMGDVGNEIHLFDDLSKIKDINNKTIHENFSLIKKKLNEKYPDKEKLNELKILLEARSESDKIKVIRGLAQTLVIAGSTPLIVNVITGNVTDTVIMVQNLIFFILSWFGILYLIKDLNGVIDRNNLLLKIVNKLLLQDEIHPTRQLEDTD